MERTLAGHRAPHTPRGTFCELRTHVVPVTLGSGARLFEDVPALNMEIISTRGASLVTHITYRVLR